MPLFQPAVDVCANAGFAWIFHWHECYPSVSRDTALCIVSNSVQHIFQVTDSRKRQLIFSSEYERGFCLFETKATSNTKMLPLLLLS